MRVYGTRQGSVGKSPMRPKGSLGMIRVDADHVDKIPPLAVTGERLSFF
jgi:citrate lyase alpha subunit